jgi:hypothetical protein
MRNFTTASKVQNAYLLRETYFEKPYRTDAILSKSSFTVPSDGNLVLFLCDSESGVPLRAVPNAIGVTWIFERPGTTLVIASGGRQEVYKAEKLSAKIEFTPQGPVL